MMVMLSNFTEWAEFIFEYGSRGPNEYEIIADS